TAAFLRSLTLEQLTIIRKQAAPGLTALHTRLAHRRSPKIIELDARLRLREAFRKFDYLTEDWKRSGGVTQAYQQMALHQLPHFVISGEDGAVWEAKEFVLQSDGSYLAQTADRKMSIRIDPEDFHAHPEDYISIPTT